MKNIDFFNKTVILRTDYNVPQENGKITSTIRIDASLKTIHYILSGNPKRLIIISHMGRPNGEDLELSLRSVKKYLQEILQQPIFWKFRCLSLYLARSNFRKNSFIRKYPFLSGRNKATTIH